MPAPRARLTVDLDALAANHAALKALAGTAEVAPVVAAPPAEELLDVLVDALLDAALPVDEEAPAAVPLPDDPEPHPARTTPAATAPIAPAASTPSIAATESADRGTSTATGSPAPAPAPVA